MEPKGRTLTCFVIGPIGNRHAPHESPERVLYEEALEAFEEVIKPACVYLGLEPVRADGLQRAGEITEQVFRRLRDDDVVIADLTGANANVMYELGLRHTRNSLTLQVGEYGRLPFDINVIRTVMFSRSPHGLAKARKELIELLESGLAGQYDPVTATRIWNKEGSAEAASDLGSDSAHETTGERQEEPPGFLDLLATAEEEQETWLAATEGIAEAVEAMGELAEQSTERMAKSDAAGRGMKGRLQVAVEYAHGLESIAARLEGETNRFAKALAAVADGYDVLLGRLETEPALLEDPDAREFALGVRRMAQTTRGTTGELNELLGSMQEAAKAARVMREPTRRIRAALNEFGSVTSVVDEWDRRLQTLGVPVPPPEWEPQQDTEETGTSEPPQ